MCSNRTITGKFENAEVKDNYLSVMAITKYGGTGIKYTLVADYPLKSEVKISFAGRGTYSLVENDRENFYDFDGVTDAEVLKVGESTWEFLYLPGIDSAGNITEINWAFDFKAFSDQYYNYKKGPEQDYYTGIIRW